MDRFERLVVLKLIKKLMILPISQEIETQDYAYNHSFKPLQNITNQMRMRCFN